MADLMGSMSIALGALRNSQEQLDVTTNNIANLNTAGYSRQRANLSESAPLQLGNLQFGTGAQIDNIESVRDQMLEFRLNTETGTQSSLDAFLQPMQQVQAYLNEASGTGLQSSMSAFFNSLTQLSTNPSNVPLRQGVITAAQNMAQSFNTTATNLNNVQSAEDKQIPSTIDQINALSKSITNLNLTISQTQNAGQNAGVLEDQRNQLIHQMSQLIDIQTVQGDHGSINISTAMGAAIVVGNQNFQLKSVTNPTTGLQDIQSSDGTNLTAAIKSGQLGGMLKVRDQEIPALQNKLDTLASAMATAINTAHKAGTDLNGAAGQNLFNIPATVAGTAATMSVNITDPTKIAASLDGTTGDNANVLAMSQIQSKTIVNGQNPVDYYSSAVSQLGSDIQQASIQSDSQNAVVQQLQNQRASVSGVSLDEESANLVQFQRAYQAAARVINVVDQMTQTVLNMGAGN